MDVYVGERVLLGEELVPAAVLVQGDKVREIVRGCTKADDEKLRCVYTVRSAYFDIMWFGVTMGVYLQLTGAYKIFTL